MLCPKCKSIQVELLPNNRILFDCGTVIEEGSGQIICQSIFCEKTILNKDLEKDSVDTTERLNLHLEGFPLTTKALVGLLIANKGTIFEKQNLDRMLSNFIIEAAYRFVSEYTAMCATYRHHASAKEIGFWISTFASCVMDRADAPDF